MDHATLSLPQGSEVFINESLRPYGTGFWDVCKNLRDKRKIHNFCRVSGISDCNGI